MEYTEDQLTEWFDFEKNKPTEVGVYEVQNTHCQWTNYSYWDGRKFKYLTKKEELPDSAFNKRHSPTGATIKEWRGLSSPPAAPKKRAGNKRKTMYVVIGQHIMDFKSKPDSSFSSKKHAEERAKYLKKIADEHFEVWIEKIRFLTPEA